MHKKWTLLSDYIIVIVIMIYHDAYSLRAAYTSQCIFWKKQKRKKTTKKTTKVEKCPYDFTLILISEIVRDKIEKKIYIYKKTRTHTHHKKSYRK